jgi:hypothetical protein
VCSRSDGIGCISLQLRVGLGRCCERHTPGAPSASSASFCGAGFLACVPDATTMGMNNFGNWPRSSAEMRPRAWPVERCA